MVQLLGDGCLALQDAAHDDLGCIILDLSAFHFLVLVDGEVVVVLTDFLNRDQEALVVAATVLFFVKVLPAVDDVGDVILVDGVALIVEREAVGLHVVEPYFVSAAGVGLGKDQDGGAHSGVWLEYAAGHRDDALQPLVVDELLADGLVCITAAEEHAVGDDAGAATSRFEHAHEQSKEQQLGFVAVDHGAQRLAHALTVQAALEGRIGEDERVTLGVEVLVTEGVASLDIRRVHVVEHHVHRADAQHGGIGVIAGEHLVLVVVELLGIDEGGFLVLVDITYRLDNKARAAHGGVADAVVLGDGRLHELHHHADDVARGTELAVSSTGSHLAQDVFIHVAHRVTVFHVQVINLLHDVLQGLGTLDEEDSIAHIAGIGRAAAVPQRLDEGEHEVSHMVKHVLAAVLAEHLPAQGAVRHRDGSLGRRIGMRPVALREGRIRDFATKQVGGRLLFDLRVVKHLHEEEVSHLAQHIHRVGDAGLLPKRVPYRVNLVFNLACNHISSTVFLCSSTVILSFTLQS